MGKARGRQGDTKDGITSIGSRFVLDSSYRTFKSRLLTKGPPTGGNDCEDLAFLTLEVVLYGLATSPELMAAISGDGFISPAQMHAIVVEAIEVFEEGEDILDNRPFTMQQADSALDGAFRVENRGTPRVDHAIKFTRAAIACIATRAWYRPRIELGPPESGKRRRRYLSTVHLSAILESMDRDQVGNEADLVSVSDETDSDIIRIDLQSAGVSELDWAVFEAYSIDEDATLELLAAREWPNEMKLSVKQIRRILKQTGERLKQALGSGYLGIN